MIPKGIIITLICLVSAPVLWGHGITVTLEKKYPCIAVRASYHGGKALADAGVTVSFALNGENTGFQKGNTDKNGTFCFYPDNTGTWLVVVDDGMGHIKKTSITLDEDFFNPLSTPAQSPAAESKIEKKDIPEKQTGAKQEKKSPPAPITRSEWCCYMLKILLGVVLILGITFILHRWTRRQNKGKQQTKN